MGSKGGASIEGRGQGRERCRAGGNRGRAGAEQGKDRCREGGGQGWRKWAAGVGKC